MTWTITAGLLRDTMVRVSCAASLYCVFVDDALKRMTDAAASWGAVYAAVAVPCTRRVLLEVTRDANNDVPNIATTIQDVTPTMEPT